VLLAITIPSNSDLHHCAFLAHGRSWLDDFEKASKRETSIENEAEQEAIVEAIKDACLEVQPLANRLERTLHPWVTFFIMPVFALANAGVAIPREFGAVLLQPVTVGVILGLVFGKPLGVFLASWLAVRIGFASLPEGVTWRHINGAGWLAGIGFTMSLFIAGLAFTSESLLDMAKLGILIASLCAGIMGILFLITIPRSANRNG
jgi:NhaA family Na+:H+ antiporter